VRRALCGLAAATMVAAVLGTASADAAGPRHGSRHGSRPAGDSAAVPGQTVVGQTAPSLTGSDCPAGFIGVQTTTLTLPSYTIPFSGVVTSFSYNAGLPTGVRALFFDPSTTPGHFTLGAQSQEQPVVPGALNTFDTRVPVRAGELLGSRTTDDHANCGFIGAAGETLSYDIGPALAAGAAFAPTLSQPDFRLNLSVVLEPDVDGDGYGDVTQDQCPQSALSQGACPAPDTRLTRTPPRRSHHRRLKLGFTSTVAGSSFECALDDPRFRPCTSPLKKKLSVGKHVVAVRSTSPFGTTDPTPAVYVFKVTARH
jgi:hypothetical protein